MHQLIINTLTLISAQSFYHPWHGAVGLQSNGYQINN